MAFVQRLINVTFTLVPAPGGQIRTFSEPGAGGNTVTLSGLRVSAKIIYAGGPSNGTAQITVFGMTRTLMNQLSTLGMIYNQLIANTVIVNAGDAVNGLTTVFGGTILQAFTDFQAAPEVAFIVMAQSGMLNRVVQIPPSSFAGSSDVATIMAGLAQQMGHTFENNGVQIRVPNVYLYGSAQDQVEKIRQATGIAVAILYEGKPGGTLAIWPSKGARTTRSIPIVAPPPLGQMIGYPIPSFYGGAICVRNVFDPSITYGTQIKIQDSVIEKANGIWNIFRLDHDLEANMPEGQWSSIIHAVSPGNPTPPVPL